MIIKSSCMQLNSRHQFYQSLGEVTDTGVYLTEEGKTGAIQQINFSV